MQKCHIAQVEIANPSTQGSGRKVSRFIPITLIIVLIAAMPSHPDLRATLAGYIYERKFDITTSKNPIKTLLYMKA